MPNYKSTLQLNNTSIQALISKAQALPLASGETLVDNSYNENVIVERTIRQYNNSRITELRPRAFNRCSVIKSIDLPNVSKVGELAFATCTALSQVNIPVAYYVGAGAFASCSSLTNLNLQSAAFIGRSAFSGCYYLSGLFLKSSRLCYLENSDAFYLTPYAGYSDYFSGTPHIYVRESLVDAYKSAANWSYFSSYFSGIESLEDDLITFTLNNNTCHARPNMTIKEWCESEYNTLGVSFVDDAVHGLAKCDNCGDWLVLIIPTTGGWTDEEVDMSTYNIIEDGDILSCDCFTFTLNGAKYQAKKGMTWGEWVESGYNTIGIKIREDGYVANSNNIAIVTDEDNIWELTATDAIIADFGYLTSAWH